MKRNASTEKPTRQAVAPSRLQHAWWSRPQLLVPLFVVAIFLIYQPAWRGTLLWDDDAHLTKPELRSLGGLSRIWFEPGATQQYYPLVHTVFWVEHHLFGDATRPYHLINIALHILGALLLWRLLLQIKIPGAALAAAFFALHPVEVESVAWISELKNTLSGVFFFAALLFYLRFDQLRRRRHYFLALALFAVGLLCKTVIAPLPAVLLVIFWWQRGKISARRDLLPLLPFFVLGIAAGLFTAWVEHRYIGAQGQAFALGAIERCLIAGRVFWFYLFKLLWPAHLIFIYPRWNVSRFEAWQYLFPAAALILLGASFALRKRSRAPLAAMLIFGGLLFPALGFINVYPFVFSFVADHFQYLASAAVFTLAASALTLLAQHLNLSRAIRYTAALVLVVVLAGLTARQSAIYADAETLYRVTLQNNPECWMAENNLSSVLADENRLPEATAHAEQALRLRPRYPEAYINLGNVFLKKEEPDEAIASYRKALELEPRLPKIYNNFGNALRLKGDWAGAIEQYQHALQLDPRSISANNNLAWLLSTCSDISLRNGARAVDLARRAASLSQGNNAVILHTLAAACAQNGQFSEAVSTARNAQQLAAEQGNTALTSALRGEIAIYQSGSAYPPQ